MDEPLLLSDLRPGQRGFVVELRAPQALRRRLWDLGLIPGAPVICRSSSPAGDPMAYFIADAVIALRKSDASQVTIRLDEGVWSWD